MNRSLDTAPMCDSSGDDYVSGSDHEDGSELMNDSDCTSDDGTNVKNIVTAVSNSHQALPQDDNSAQMQRKKIGPQRQKKEIHTYLKKARKYEIRRLTRRICTLRNLKGSDQQKAKNNRKAATLVEEIQAMKGFFIDQLTERTVDIFKGKAEQIYLDMWIAAQDHKKFEDMLQTLSSENDEKKYEKIGFFRMISSKDIVGKLQLVYSGVNIKRPKSKKALRKLLRKFNQKNKKLKKKPSADQGDVLKNTVKQVSNNTNKLKKKPSTDQGDEPKDNVNQVSKNTKSKVKVSKSKSDKMGGNEISEMESSNLKKVKTNKQVSDPFFLPNSTTMSYDSSDDSDGNDEFSAPVNEGNIAIDKKKNRMGQRQRKKLINGEQRKSFTAKLDRKQRVSSKFSNNRSKPIKKGEFVGSKIKDDKELHPSWLAKQRLKAQQGIAPYTGTKLKFDD